MSADELTDYQNGKRSGLDLLNVLRKKELIVRGDDGVFYYDGLVEILLTLENHQLVEELFEKTGTLR